MKRIVIMGIQGCGKGTQAALLAEETGFRHIDVGGLFRTMTAGSGPLARRLAEIMAAGEFLPDDLVVDVVNEALDAQDPEHGYILDGYPRNAFQAEAMLSRHRPDVVLHISVPDEIVLDRITARRHCDACGEGWNLLFRPPARPGLCDACGGRLVCREDDHPEAVRSRLATFHRETEPVLERFGSLVVPVDGSGSVAEVQAGMLRAAEIMPVAEPVV